MSALIVSLGALYLPHLSSAMRRKKSLDQLSPSVLSTLLERTTSLEASLLFLFISSSKIRAPNAILLRLSLSKQGFTHDQVRFLVNLASSLQKLDADYLLKLLTIKKPAQVGFEDSAKLITSNTPVEALVDYTYRIFEQSLVSHTSSILPSIYRRLMEEGEFVAASRLHALSKAVRSSAEPLDVEA